MAYSSAPGQDRAQQQSLPQRALEETISIHERLVRTTYGIRRIRDEFQGTTSTPVNKLDQTQVAPSSLFHALDMVRGQLAELEQTLTEILG